MDKIIKLIEESDEITLKEVREEVEEKKEELENKKRKYKGHPIENTIAFKQENYPWKILVLDEIYFEEKDKYEYRFAYWVVSDKKLKEDKIRIMYGQFAMLIPPEDFKKLMEKANEINWKGPGLCLETK